MNNLTIEILEKDDWYKCNSVDAGEAMAMVTSQLIATMKALEVAKEKLSFYADHKKSMFDTGGQAKIALKEIEQILGAKP